MFIILESDDEDEDDEEYYESEVTRELTCVGAGIGGGYRHSSELKVLNYKQAMKLIDKEEWKNEIEK